ncbi:MAG TPA: GlsB/YeaQ/YmgE family stress response membrane protein [Candidatus Eisenbacteria bacterium]|nr:GlsB/YeaQ/YmgE family stress response membrane protein [Candidatus Eisenbacteria bacterium]
MSTTTLVWFLLIGLCAGWLASNLVKGGGYGLIGDIVVGVIGALLGGWLFSVLGITAPGMLGLLITAFVGAAVLISLLRVIRHT